MSEATEARRYIAARMALVAARRAANGAPTGTVVSPLAEAVSILDGRVDVPRAAQKSARQNYLSERARIEKCAEHCVPHRMLTFRILGEWADGVLNGETRPLPPPLVPLIETQCRIRQFYRDLLPRLRDAYDGGLVNPRAGTSLRVDVPGWTFRISDHPPSLGPTPRDYTEIAIGDTRPGGNGDWAELRFAEDVSPDDACREIVRRFPPREVDLPEDADQNDPGVSAFGCGVEYSPGHFTSGRARGAFRGTKVVRAGAWIVALRAFPYDDTDVPFPDGPRAVAWKRA